MIRDISLHPDKSKLNSLWRRTPLNPENTRRSYPARRFQVDHSRRNGGVIEIYIKRLGLVDERDNSGLDEEPRDIHLDGQLTMKVSLRAAEWVWWWIAGGQQGKKGSRMARRLKVYRRSRRL